MGLDYQVYGETMVTLKGGAHLGSGLMAGPADLGLSHEAVQVVPIFNFRDVKVDDFGPHVPADVQWMLSHVLIKTTLIWYDNDVLDVALNESMGGGGGPIFNTNGGGGVGRGTMGMVAPAGQLLGCRNRIHASGNHFFSVMLNNTTLDQPWRFLQCHFTERPVLRKIGTAVTIAEVSIRALPYADPYRSGLNNPNLPPPPWSFTENGILYSKRAEVVSSGAILWDRQLDT